MKALILLFAVLIVTGCAASKDYNRVDTPNPLDIPEKLDPGAPLTDEEQRRLAPPVKP